MREIIISEVESSERVVHILEEKEDWAIKAAMAANRPLLIRGEPGIGKTQLARAAAIDLKRPLVSLTVDSNTESRELMWSFDAVQRLAEAQIASVVTKDESVLNSKIDVKKFVRPGPIWWAFNWESAKSQLRPHEKPPCRLPTKWKQHDGVVILIDEIDKAESDVPNGLLEAFGSREFTPQGWDEPISLPEGAAAPLVVITTNEERTLPDAFIRRCFVLHLELPSVPVQAPTKEHGKKQDAPFLDYLIRRGRAHFPKASKDLPARAAKLLLSDRRRAIHNHQTPLPGQAEYLDFLRAIVNLVAKGGDEDEIFKQVQSFVFEKSGKAGS